MDNGHQVMSKLLLLKWNYIGSSFPVPYDNVLTLSLILMSSFTTSTISIIYVSIIY